MFRKTTAADVNSVMQIIDGGKAYLKSQGIDQWQNGYPNHESILQDIENGESYVLESDGQVVGTAMLSFAGEKSYDYIESGNWLDNRPYGVLHRVAVDSNLKGRGLAVHLIEEAAKICRQQGIYSLRIDTHEKNSSMQNLLKKTGFANCGIIYLEPDTSGEVGVRRGFEKLLD